MNDDIQTLSTAPVGYLQQFQLTREPFAQDANSAQDEFFLLDSDRAQRLNMLYHMCQNSELLLVVTGVEGSGKTSLLHKFIDMRTESWRQCIVNANTMTNPDQLLIEIAEGFGLPQDSVNFGSGLDMLQKRLTEMKLSELMPILIIDDAHELPTASLTILLKLSELSEGGERLLRIVLFGEPSITEMFKAPELQEVRHRITHTLTMPSLTEQQSIDYIQYRLSVAGLQGDGPFSQGQMKRIHRQANGIPGQINHFAQEALLATSASKTGHDAISLSMRLRSGVTILIMLGIAGTITWYLSQDVISTLGDNQEDSQAKLETRDLPLIPPSTRFPDKDTPLNSNTPEQPIVTAASKNGSDTTPTTDINPFAIKSPKPETKPKLVAKKEPEAKLAPAIKPAPVAKPVPEIKPETVIQKKPEAKPVPAVKPAPVTKPVPEIKPAPVAKKEPKIKPVPVAKPVVKKDWLEQQNPTYFTLQLMGSRQRTSLATVQNAYKIASQSAIIKTNLNGKPWYILVYNSYKTKQQARDGAKKLPKPLQLTQPWPRLIGELKTLK